jgi:hypothetical protein
MGFLQLILGQNSRPKKGAVTGKVVNIYCDMRPERRNNPLPHNASLTNVSVTTSCKNNLLGNGQQWDTRCLVAVIARCSTNGYQGS